MKYKVEDIVPVGNEILVQQDKPHQIVTVSRKRTDDAMKREAEFYANKETDETGQWKDKAEFVYSDEDFIEEKVKVNSKFRTGVVLRVPVYPEGYNGEKIEIGQRIIFEDGGQVPMDILTSKVGDERCPVIVRGFNIKGIIN